MAPNELRFNKVYVQVYIVWMKFFLVELMPYVIILVLNTIMIVRWVSLKLHQGFRVGLASGDGRRIASRWEMPSHGTKKRPLKACAEKERLGTMHGIIDTIMLGMIQHGRKSHMHISISV